MRMSGTGSTEGEVLPELAESGGFGLHSFSYAAAFCSLAGKRRMWKGMGV